MHGFTKIAILGLLSACILTAPCFDDDPKDTPKQQLEKLLEAYKAYGLPLPPADAKLVRYQAQGEGQVTMNGIRQPAKYALGFMLKAPTKSDDGQLFHEGIFGSFENSPITLYKKWEVVEPMRDVVNRIDSHGYLMAILCHARGWTDLAASLLERYRKDHEGDTTKELGLAAWRHWTWDLSSPEVDWTKRAAQLKFILDSQPKTFELHHRSLLRSMELALQPSKAKPGSMDALLDGLIREPMETSTFFGELKGSAAYRKVVRGGFAIVPTLIAHLDDERLTRTKRHGFNNFPGFQYRIQHIVSDMLQDLAGEDLGKDWLRRTQGYTVQKTDAEAWWKEARSLGEEQYLIRHALGASPDSKWPSQIMLYIIAHKHPQNLAGLYRKMLAERPKMVGWPVASAVAESTLSKEKKREIFLMVAAAKNLDHRCDGLWELEKIDPKRFDPIMIATLEEMAKVAERHNSRYAHLAQQTANPEIWAALRKAAERAEPALRLEYLDAMHAYEERKPAKRQQLLFLAHFLEDAAEAKYGWSGFATIQVRKMAAWRIAGILEMDDRPESNWTDAQWAALRKKAMAALEGEGIK